MFIVYMRGTHTQMDKIAGTYIADESAARRQAIAIANGRQHEVYIVERIGDYSDIIWDSNNETVD